ncbi:malate dehydrogenase [Campylobacter volucris]|uniref:malate dehydrogenase n=1 Tax=Campylobacter volucris TaxID=1031542 RepID=UPI00189DB7C2|nr:malate dehydrogenase [Campylobacter volucris]MBF7044035.1 malate dehydrogenase [Campylobacter volucris]
MKIAIIGAGNVGSSIAYGLILRELVDEIVLIDINEDLLFAKELELSQSIAAFNFNIDIKCSSDYVYTKNCDIVIFSAGIARKEGQSREELLAINSNILLNCAKKIKEFTQDPLFIIVSNPVDFLLNALYEQKIFSSQKIVAMAGVLDNARFKYEVAKKSNIKSFYVDTKLMGFHNDDMVLLYSQSKINNQNINEILPEDDLAYIENEVKKGGAKVIKHLKTSAYLAPASACIRMIESLKSGEFLPMSVILNGEYGVYDKAFGVLARLSLNGVVEILNLKLNSKEEKELQNSLEKHKYM